MEKKAKVTMQSESNKGNMSFQTVPPQLSINNVVSNTNGSCQKTKHLKINKETDSFLLTEQLLVLNRRKYGPNAIMLSCDKPYKNQRQNNMENPTLRQTIDFQREKRGIKPVSHLTFSFAKENLNNIDLYRQSRDMSFSNINKSNLRAISVKSKHKRKVLSPAVRSKNSEPPRSSYQINKTSSNDASPLIQQQVKKKQKEIYKEFISMLKTKDMKQRVNIVCEAVSQAKQNKMSN